MISIKVCGMRDAANIQAATSLPIQWMGFIFYAPSPRNALDLAPEALSVLPASIHRTGVFVNSSFESIMETAGRFGLDTIQLHGSESSMFCHRLYAQGLEVIKAIPVSAPIDTEAATTYEGHCHYLLFDTRTIQMGGSGKRYDWDILKTYRGTTPFLLSGGIGEEDAERIALFRHPMLAGVDLNSRFESAPGLKLVTKIECFIQKLPK